MYPWICDRCGARFVCAADNLGEICGRCGAGTLDLDMPDDEAFALYCEAFAADDDDDWQPEACDALDALRDAAIDEHRAGLTEPMDDLMGPEPGTD